jgi:hypothetical protein
MSCYLYTFPDALDTSGANTVSVTFPFDVIVKMNESFAHVTTVLSGDAIVDIKEGSTVKGTFTLGTDAADNSSVKGVGSTATIPDFHVTAGTAVNLTVSNTATSGVVRGSIAYSPAVQ